MGDQRMFTLAGEFTGAAPPGMWAYDMLAKHDQDLVEMSSTQFKREFPCESSFDKELQDKLGEFVREPNELRSILQEQKAVVRGRISFSILYGEDDSCPYWNYFQGLRNIFEVVIVGTNAPDRAHALVEFFQKSERFRLSMMTELREVHLESRLESSRTLTGLGSVLVHFIEQTRM